MDDEYPIRIILNNIIVHINNTNYVHCTLDNNELQALYCRDVIGLVKTIMGSVLRLLVGCLHLRWRLFHSIRYLRPSGGAHKEKVGFEQT